MDFKEMVKRTKNDLKNVNSLVEKLKECRTNLNYFKGQEELYSEDVKELNTEINYYKYKLEIIKISLGILCERDQQIITDSYFEKIITKNIAIKLNVSSETVSVRKRRAIEELAKIMYGHLDGFNDISFLEAPKEYKKRSSRIYQYDLQGKFMKRWDSANECNENGFDKRNIYSCCTGTYKQYKGYKWAYKPLALDKDEAI